MWTKITFDDADIPKLMRALLLAAATTQEELESLEHDGWYKETLKQNLDNIIRIMRSIKSQAGLDVDSDRKPI